MKLSLVLIAIASAILGLPALLCADPPTERKSGKVLILPNQRILEGDIERLGNRFRVRRAQGELWLPADKAVCLCNDWNDAYAFMAAQSNLLDPDERMRLAKWCQSNALYDLALKEVNFVLDLRPKDTAAQHLKILVEQQARSSEKRVSPSLQTVSFEAPASLDVGVKSLAMFSARVQPILMNTCARCHVSEKNIPFRLFRVTDTNFRNAMQNNLLSALAQIDTENPDLSPLLNKAVNLHGGSGKAPLNGRDTVPFQIMQQWVQQVIDNNPHLRAQRAARTPEARQVPHHDATPERAKVETTQPDSPPAPNNLPSLPTEALAQKPSAATIQSGFASTPQQQPRELAPAVVAGPPDPYDPNAFNKTMHPQR